MLAAAAGALCAVLGAAGAAAATGAGSGVGPGAVAVVRCDLAVPTVEVTYSDHASDAVAFTITLEGPVAPDPAVGDGPTELLVAPGASTIMDYPLNADATAITLAAAGRSISATFAPTDCGAAVGFDLAPPPLLRRFGRW
jgi:hypothetical protein